MIIKCTYANGCSGPAGGEPAGERRKRGMARPMGVSKVPSAYFGNREEFHKISKAAWADLYFDLYAQSSGRCDDVTAEEVIQDALKRLKTLKANGIR